MTTNYNTTGDKIRQNGYAAGFNRDMDLYTQRNLERVEEIGAQIAQHNEQHRELTELSIQLFKDIKAALPQDQRHLLGLLEEYNNDLSGLLQLAAYQGALNDAKRVIDRIII